MSADQDTIPVPRWWLERTHASLQGELPSGRIGDAVFLLRDIIGDMLAKNPPRRSIREVLDPERKQSSCPCGQDWQHCAKPNC